jgi:hypothetical protein
MTKNGCMKIYAAVQAAHNAPWTIGDALLEECGEPSEQGVSDGSWGRLAECAAELEQRGMREYSIHSLAMLRTVAYDFPKSARQAVSWSAHREARTPATLMRIISGAPKGQMITRDYVREVMRQQRKRHS